MSQSNQLVSKAIEIQQNTLENSQEAVEQAVEIPMQQSIELQKNAAKLFLDGLEMTNWFQNRNAELTRDAFQSYIDTVENVAEDTTYWAEQGVREAADLGQRGLASQQQLTASPGAWNAPGTDQEYPARQSTPDQGTSPSPGATANPQVSPAWRPAQSRQPGRYQQPGQSQQSGQYQPPGQYQQPVQSRQSTSQPAQSMPQSGPPTSRPVTRQPAQTGPAQQQPSQQASQQPSQQPSPQQPTGQTPQAPPAQVGQQPQSRQRLALGDGQLGATPTTTNQASTSRQSPASIGVPGSTRPLSAVGQAQVPQQPRQGATQRPPREPMQREPTQRQSAQRETTQQRAAGVTEGTSNGEAEPAEMPVENT